MIESVTRTFRVHLTCDGAECNKAVRPDSASERRCYEMAREAGWEVDPDAVLCPDCCKKRDEEQAATPEPEAFSLTINIGPDWIERIRANITNISIAIGCDVLNEVLRAYEASKSRKPPPQPSDSARTMAEAVARKFNTYFVTGQMRTQSMEILTVALTTAIDDAVAILEEKIRWD